MTITTGIQFKLQSKESHYNDGYITGAKVHGCQIGSGHIKAAAENEAEFLLECKRIKTKQNKTRSLCFH
jgi:hypothetical protein